MVNILDTIFSGNKTFQRAKGAGNPIVNDDLAIKQYVDEQILSGLGTSTLVVAASALVFNLASVNIANDTETEIPWNAEDHDTDNFHSVSANTGKMFIPTDGSYTLLTSILYQAFDVGTRKLRIYKNFGESDQQLLAEKDELNPALLAPTEVQLQITKNLTSGSTVSVTTIQDSGQPLGICSGIGLSISGLGSGHFSVVGGNAQGVTISGIVAGGDLTGTYPNPTVKEDAKVRQNLCLNPGFETVLPGTHTADTSPAAGTAPGIKQNDNASEIKCQFPGWITKTGASGDITIDAETGATNVSATGSQQSMKITVTTDTNKPTVFQRWDAGEFLEDLAHQCRGRTINIFMDVRQTAGSSAAAIRLFVFTDGTGGTTTFGDYHAANSNFERLLVTVSVPTDATDIEFGVEIDDTDGEGEDPFYIDNVMVVPSNTALTVLEYEPRIIPVFESPHIDGGNVLVYSTPSDTILHDTGGGDADTDFDINANRPAWATHMIMMLLANSTSAAGQEFRMRPKGDSNNFVFGASQNTVAEEHVFAAVPVGQDGQMEFGVSAQPNSNGFVQLKGWKGVSL